MDFNWGEAEQRLRRELEELIASEFPDEPWGRDEASLGSSGWNDGTARFTKRLAEAGHLVRNWPSEYGGAGASTWEQLVLGEVMWAHGEPRGPMYMNANWIGPAIIRYGTEEQKQQFLPSMARGEMLWCQGFSEPDAGSDLASMRTRAILDGDHYVVNGQKIWTSYANVAEWCFLLVRTGAPESRGRGITVLLLPMDTPGVTVRPIASIAGGHAFHELTFDDVFVPVSARLGDHDGGWSVVRSVLADERVGNPRYVRARRVLDTLAEAAKERGVFDRADVRALFGRALASCEAARMLMYRTADGKAKGRDMAGIANVARVALVDTERIAADLAVAVVGSAALAEGTLGDSQYRNAMASSVAAGAYEIQLNQIAQTLLGMPR